MKTIKESDKVYNQCVSEGTLQEPEEIDIEKAKSLLDLAEQDLKAIGEVVPHMEKKGGVNILWSHHYEILRQLVQGILLLEKIRSVNHQCLYAYICTKHKEWDIDWETIETMRLLRNGVHYDGKPVTTENWKEYKLKFHAYIQTFIRILKKNIEECE